MKKLLCALICISMLLPVLPAMAEEQISIVIDGQKLEAKDVNGNVVYPIAIDGTTYLPVRAIGSAFGRKVEWDSASNTVYIGEKGAPQTYSEDIKVVIDGTVIDPKDVNGRWVPPFVLDGTTYLPVRAVAEAFDKIVMWEGSSNSVLLISEDPFEMVDTFIKALNDYDLEKMKSCFFAGSQAEIDAMAFVTDLREAVKEAFSFYVRAEDIEHYTDIVMKALLSTMKFDSEACLVNSGGTFMSGTFASADLDGLGDMLSKESLETFGYTDAGFAYQLAFHYGVKDPSKMSDERFAEAFANYLVSAGITPKLFDAIDKKIRSMPLYSGEAIFELVYSNGRWYISDSTVF